jgi:hypothetical protein
MYKTASRDQNIDRIELNGEKDTQETTRKERARHHAEICINLRENCVALLRRRRARGKSLLGRDDDTIVFVLAVHRRHRNRRADLELFERLLRDGRRRVHSERRRGGRGELLGDGLHFVYQMCACGCILCVKIMKIRGARMTSNFSPKTEDLGDQKGDDFEREKPSSMASSPNHFCAYFSPVN